MNITPRERAKYHLLPSNQTDARKLGVNYYFTGKACKRGHISIRGSKSGSCYECTLDHNRNHYNRYNVWPPRNEHLQALLDAQNSLCAICKNKLNQDFHVDHCHKTGMVRGILCGICNRGLGCFQDNPIFLESAVSYLKQEHTKLRYKSRRRSEP